MEDNDFPKIEFIFFSIEQRHFIESFLCLFLKMVKKLQGVSVHLQKLLTTNKSVPKLKPY